MAQISPLLLSNVPGKKIIATTYKVMKINTNVDYTVPRKCPKCLKQDTARYCPACGTEMFLPERFMFMGNKMETTVINGIDNTKLTQIKLAHTAIWFMFVLAILYILYAGIFDKINALVWLCIGAVVIEGIVLLIFNGKCPFTIAGYKYAVNPQVGFDIFLPLWLAKHNKIIFSTLFIIGLALVAWRVLL